MGRFNSNAATQLHEDEGGIDLHLRFRPNDKVFYLTNGGVTEGKVIRVKTVHRSLLTTGYHPAHTVTIVMENGTERREDECFASREELAEWIKNPNTDEE